MNELAIYEKTLPGMWERLNEDARRILEAHMTIKSYADLESWYLLGSGLAATTYRSYMVAVRSFWKFTEGLTPFQVEVRHIEAWYDSMAELDKNTRYGRVRGLKKFFEGVNRMHPTFVSPFHHKYMSDKLRRKLNARKSGNRTKAALSRSEIHRILEWLTTDTSIKGVCDKAIIFTLLTSGLRSAELLQLHWRDVTEHEGVWTATFTGKGDKDAEQEMFAPAIEACREYFIIQHRREPQPDDALFWTVPAFKGDISRPMPYHTLWRRVTEVGVRAKAEGVLTRNIQFTPHLMRRSYATLLYKSGMKLKAIQEKTRHASVEVLVKHYIKDEDPASPYLNEALA